MDKIKIIRAPTKEALFKKTKKERGEVERMSISRMNGEFRMTVVFK